MLSIRRLPLTIMLLLTVVSFSALVHAPPPGRGPTIETPSIDPTNPGFGTPVTVSVVVYDTQGVQNVSIAYSTDNFTSVTGVLPAEYNSTSSIAKASIPGQWGGRVAYYVEAFDVDGNRNVNDNGGAYFTYDVAGGPAAAITSFWGLLVIGVVAAATGVLLIGYLRRRKAAAGNQTRARRQPSPQP